MQTPSKTSFSSCCVYHRTLSRVRVERKALSLRSCIAQFDPWSCRDHVGRAPLRRSVRDINTFQNDCVIISTETCFWLKHVSNHTFFWRFSPPNQNSFAFICKNHPESCVETLILRQMCDDIRTLSSPKFRKRNKGYK